MRFPILIFTGALAASLSTLGVQGVEFDLKKCPTRANLPPKEGFQLDRFMGKYYELAFHDYTQFPTCPSLSCVTSEKTLDAKSEDPVRLDDAFMLRCFGADYTFPLKFDQKNDPGYMLGWIEDPPFWWSALFEAEYDNTVVDFEVDEQNQYKWVIEFQCTMEDNGSKVKFTGINFYARDWDLPESEVDEMINRARAAGLSAYIDVGWGTRKLDHSGCGWEPTNSGRDTTPFGSSVLVFQDVLDEIKEEAAKSSGDDTNTVTEQPFSLGAVIGATAGVMLAVVGVVAMVVLRQQRSKTNEQLTPNPRYASGEQAI